MGNREDLIEGAKRCLYKKGYARTTARDIAAASGVSLAAIGYHFRSKDALLHLALVEAIREWGDALQRELAAVHPPADAGPLERFEWAWAGVIALFARYRQLWVANFEVMTQFEQAPDEVRQVLSDAHRQGRLGLAMLFQNIDPAADEERALVVGAFHQALLLGVMGQWLLYPEHAPSASELADALRMIVANIDAGEESAPISSRDVTATAG